MPASGPPPGAPPPPARPSAEAPPLGAPRRVCERAPAPRRPPTPRSSCCWQGRTTPRAGAPLLAGTAACCPRLSLLFFIAARRHAAAAARWINPLTPPSGPGVSRTQFSPRCRGAGCSARPDEAGTGGGRRRPPAPALPPAPSSSQRALASARCPDAPKGAPFRDFSAPLPPCKGARLPPRHDSRHTAWAIGALSYAPTPFRPPRTPKDRGPAHPSGAAPPVAADAPPWAAPARLALPQTRPRPPPRPPSGRGRGRAPRRELAGPIPRNLAPRPTQIAAACRARNPTPPRARRPRPPARALGRRRAMPRRRRAEGPRRGPRPAPPAHHGPDGARRRRRCRARQAPVDSRLTRRRLPPPLPTCKPVSLACRRPPRLAPAHCFRVYSLWPRGPGLSGECIGEGPRARGAGAARRAATQRRRRQGVPAGGAAPKRAARAPRPSPRARCAGKGRRA
jgi:hypothetical protein